MAAQGKFDQTKPVTTRQYNAGALVRQLWGAKYNKADTAYEFSNGKKFDSSDRGETGVYKKP